jgi:nucleotide-binding universal stress UspA family protein
MVHFSKILIPIDFSERCLGAARFAIPLAERFHSEITFLHVEPPPEYDSEENAEREARVEKQLRDFLCAAFAHLDVKRILRVGPDVGSEIVQSAREQQSDLIMMPTHGYGVFRRLLLGSVTAKVLHDTDCPVWTGAHLAQGPPTEWINPTVVLCAADAAPANEKPLLWASEMASELDAALFLVHVEPRLESPGEGYYSHEYHRGVMEEAKRKMEQLQRAAGTHAQVLIEAGNVPRAVCTAVKRVGSDLLVIGRGGGAGPGRLGLNAYGIIRESPCPVISV